MIGMRHAALKKIIIIASLLMPFLAAAHPTGGTIEKIEGNYYIDIGFKEQVLRADIPSRFDFGVYNNPDKTAVDYDSAYVRIMSGDKFIFTGTLPKQSYGTAGMTFTFPLAG